MYEALGFTGSKALLISGIYNCVGPLASKSRPSQLINPLLHYINVPADLIFIVFLLDRVGRRKPLLFGTVGITCALICEAVINSQNEEGKRHSLSVAGVFFIFLVSIIFSLSFGPISWVYMSEYVHFFLPRFCSNKPDSLSRVMPMQIRARGNAFATGIGNWLVATLFAQVSPIGLGKIGWKFYFVFVAFNIIITFPVIFFFFKETKQVSLEDIDLLFGERALGTLPVDLGKEGVEMGTHVERYEGERGEGKV
jgi:MFS family permease